VNEDQADRDRRARFLAAAVKAQDAMAAEIGPGWRDPENRRRLRRGSSLVSRVVAGAVRAERDRCARRAVRARG
jgi:hypothetical protein